MGRPRLWKIKALSRSEVEARNRFLESLEKLLTKSNIRERLRMDWELFLRLNNLAPCPASLNLFVADMALSVRESTAYEYASKMSSLQALKLPGMRTTWSHLCRLLNVRAADAESKHALDIDHGTAEAIIEAVENECDRNALRVTLLIGPRSKDVTHLRTHQLDIPFIPLSKVVKKQYYRAQVRIAKNRKTLGKRVNLYVPVEMRMPVRASANKLAKFLERMTSGEKIFAGCTASRLNRGLAAACLKLGLPRVTTYSFRRLYICEAIRYEKRNFTKVRDLTLHFAEETIRAFYDRW